ncbi:MAG: histidine phosphatase family protein [Planctomycetaceae bacterium]|nr:histidine phosphatase family protein [Planctomycetaceae bacterium]
MKTLILMRHSQAVSNNPAYADHERPLTDAGRQLVESTAAALEPWPVDQVICSSAVRTCETAQLLAASNVPRLEPLVTKDLYLAPPDAYSRVAAELADSDTDVLLMIGHNPGIASLIWSLSQEAVPISPGTAAVFQVRIDDWSELSRSSVGSGSLLELFDLIALVSSGARIR